MNFKLDENLGAWAAELLAGAGHDAATVHSQGLEGSEDPDLIRICRDEIRCLVTLDVEFGNPLLFPPRDFRGIVLLRIRGRIDRETLELSLRTLLDALDRKDVRGMPVVDEVSPVDRRLWIVEPGRVRIYQPPPGQEPLEA